MSNPPKNPELVCVTGASGGLGRALVGRLATESVGVIGLSMHDPGDGVGPFTRYIREDVATTAWDRVIDGCSTVFHLAAAVHQVPRTASEEQRVFAVNHEATARLAAACRESGAKLVYASTVAVFGPLGTRRPGDGGDMEPVTPYARSKWLSEQAIQWEEERGLRFVILRFPLLYGPNGRGNMERLLREIGRGRYWPIDGDGTRKSCLFLDDAAEALLRAWRSQEALRKTFVVAPEEAPTLRQIQRAAYEALGRRMPRPHIPRRAALLAAHSLDLCARIMGRRTRIALQVRTLTKAAEYDGSRFAAATGFRPRTDLSTGLRETARWLREQSPGAP